MIMPEYDNPDYVQGFFVFVKEVVRKRLQRRAAQACAGEMRSRRIRFDPFD